ncbi:hypothetical protein D5R81_00805 [Parashewanella spongiae]|uniref:Uncharacterized protein n=1 Tax=Parashewanella spongiae TaxID=342950 RepID=A0A3A6TY10_9GAMM|nr:hypothetical protein D5R81_00805 [Parashewanella spongiae]
MFKVISKLLILVLVLVTFLAQVMAYNTSFYCETSSQHAHDDSVSLKESPSSFSKVSEATIDCCSTECCDLNCICIANACSYFVYLPFEVGSSKVVIVSEAISTQKFEPISLAFTLPYRPPIYFTQPLYT